MERFYYVNRNVKLVIIRGNAFVNLPDGMEFLGSTDNPRPKMAAQAFLKGEEGYVIEDTTK